MLQKKIKEKDAKRAVIGITQKVKIEENVLIVKGQETNVIIVLIYVVS